MSIPLDSDGFLRRECPTCEQQFKWHPNDDDAPDIEVVNQYFCPLCGVPSGLDTWWTREQLEHAQALVMPEAMRQITDALDGAFKASKHVRFKRSSSGNGDLPVPDVLHDPDDMVIVEPPCHPSEPVKVPDSATSRVYCLICGEPYSV